MIKNKKNSCKVLIFFSIFAKIEKSFKKRDKGEVLNKLILKTASITLASIIAVSVLLFGAFWLFAPSTLAKAFNGLGNYSASIYFYKVQYDKTGSINDLSNLVINVNEKLDPEFAMENLGKLIMHADFDEFCKTQDEKGDSKINTAEYYYGKYATLLARNGKMGNALTVCKMYVEDYFYTDYNPYKVILFELGSILSKQDLELMKTSIEELLPSLFSSFKTDAMNDIDSIDQLIKAI